MKKTIQKTQRQKNKRSFLTDSLTSSFRDPSGFVFKEDGEIYRQINKFYQKEYDFFLSSGLYEKLISLGYIIPHALLDLKKAKDPNLAYKVIKPEKIPFWSYPYEWCFGQLKDGALLTLKIQEIALVYGMSLKDASSFNIQFLKGKPILIDSLSLEIYKEGKPWVAYKQFVETFLAPLSLMSMVDVRLGRLLVNYLDGVPLDLTSKMLPFRSKLNLSLLFHIHAHSKTQIKSANKKIDEKKIISGFSKRAFLGLIESLKSALNGLKWDFKKTQWAKYYEKEGNNYNDRSFRAKINLTEKFLKIINPKTVWDLGANTGYFSRIASGLGSDVVSFDADFGALEQNYNLIKEKNEEKILPLFSDLTNPSPSLGWENDERLSLFQRGPTNTLLALALIHHLAISKNVPFDFLASSFSKMGEYLIIEYVPKDDSQVQILLANRKDIFTNYSKGNFEKVFSNFFKIITSESIETSKRTLYLMKKV